jgi:hypothetical protein
MRLTAGHAKSGDCHEGAPALSNDGHWWCRPLTDFSARSPAFHRMKLNGRATGGCGATRDKVVSRHGGLERDRFKQGTLSCYETGHL